MLPVLKVLVREHSGSANHAAFSQENRRSARASNADRNLTTIGRVTAKFLHDYSLAKWTVEGFGTREKRIAARRKIKASSSPGTARAKEIMLKSMNLTTLPPFFLATSHFKNFLNVLTISHNAIEAIPREIGNLENLTFLDLSNNSLSELPIEFANLKNLKQLYLTDNKFKNVPPQIWDLKNLDTLNASENQIEELPTEIVNLVSLKVLNLGKNLLKKLPKELGKLLLLAEITLYENQLLELPNELGDLENLREINVVGNEELSNLPTSLQHRKKSLAIVAIGTKISPAQL